MYTDRLARFAPHFRYDQDQLWVEGVPLAELVKRFGSPLFVYSKAAFTARAEHYLSAFADLPMTHHVALKANDNLTLLHHLAARGFGADAASLGELHRAEAAGFPPELIVMNGNGKGEAELIRAHRMEIAQIIVDALFELEPLVETAAIVGRTRVPIGLRLNPAIDPLTHPYLATGLATSKFGLPAADLPVALDFIRAHPMLELTGLHCHLGSMIEEGSPYLEAMAALRQQADTLREQGFPIREISLGGGFAVPYAEGEEFALRAYTAALQAQFGDTDYALHQEPGRFLFAECGLLAMTSRGVKRTPAKTFLVVDAGMTDNLRPALYHARHPVVPVHNTSEAELVDLVGPNCESGDFLALDIELPPLERGELLAQLTVGAYSYAMQSHYNGRLRPAEVWVNGNVFEVIRDREQLEDLGRKDLFFAEELSL